MPFTFVSRARCLQMSDSRDSSIEIPFPSPSYEYQGYNAPIPEPSDDDLKQNPGLKTRIAYAKTSRQHKRNISPRFCEVVQQIETQCEKALKLPHKGKEREATIQSPDVQDKTLEYNAKCWHVSESGLPEEHILFRLESQSSQGRCQKSSWTRQIVIIQLTVFNDTSKILFEFGSRSHRYISNIDAKEVHSEKFSADVPIRRSSALVAQQTWLLLKCRNLTNSKEIPFLSIDEQSKISQSLIILYGNM